MVCSPLKNAIVMQALACVASGFNHCYKCIVVFSRIWFQPLLQVYSSLQCVFMSKIVHCYTAYTLSLRAIMRTFIRSSLCDPFEIILIVVTHLKFITAVSNIK